MGLGDQREELILGSRVLERLEDGDRVAVALKRGDLELSCMPHEDAPVVERMLKVATMHTDHKEILPELALGEADRLLEISGVLIGLRDEFGDPFQSLERLRCDGVQIPNNKLGSNAALAAGWRLRRQRSVVGRRGLRRRR